MMQNSAKNSPPSVKAENEDRDGLVREARRWMKAGGSVAAFARSHGIARTTVRGWLKGHDGRRGRSKKLGPFEETEILKLILMADAGLQDWKTVMKTVRRQSGESISRRSVLRFLRRWGLVALHPGLAGTISVKVILWEQPKETMQKGSKALMGVLWLIHSGRGSEGFMLTSGESAYDLAQVTTAITGKLKGRNKCVLTNHPQLAELLRTALPRWVVRLEK